MFEFCSLSRPLPPVSEDGSLTDVPSLEFTKVSADEYCEVTDGEEKVEDLFGEEKVEDLFVQVECLIFTFHCIGKQAPRVPH